MTHHMTDPTSVFNLPERLAEKASARLIGRDEEHLRLVAATIAGQERALAGELDELRRAPGGSGRGALDRDLAIHRLSGRLGMLRRYGRDLCLGKIVPADGSASTWIGRLGLTDAAGDPLLVDWRAPAAEPFFAATTARPLGLASRRRYRWAGGRIVDYWDDALSPLPPDAAVALDDDSAFIAGLAASRSPRMRDVLATIQADQDAIIRADSAGALVVDGGPGTGKTVVALHRAAYLLYADPRLKGHRGGVLVAGPHEPYLGYVADVLPSLGEDGVLTCTLRDLVPEGAAAVPEPDPRVARLKSDVRMSEAVGPAVALYEEAPREDTLIETAWGDVVLSPADWREAFGAAEDGAPHNEAADDIWEALLDIAMDNGPGEDEVPRDDLRRALASHPELRRTFRRTWPMLEASDLVGDLWDVPAYLRRCAPWLDADERAALRRPEGSAWTTAHLPLLDAMRARLGDPDAARVRQQARAALAEDRAYMDEVVSTILASNDDPDSPLPLLNRASLREDLLHDEDLPALDRDPLAGPFAHVIVDEAQELTDAQWQMLLRRVPSRSVTVVGDRAQARVGFPEPWAERLRRVGFDGVREASLTINYRTPRQVMDAAAPVIREALPDANVPTSIRDGVPVRHAPVADLDAFLDAWLAEHAEGTACVIVAAPDAGRQGAHPGRPSAGAPAPGRARVSVLDPVGVKGLEFDLVVVVEPAGFGEGVQGAVDRYVAMTRATQELVILEG